MVLTLLVGCAPAVPAAEPADEAETPTSAMDKPTKIAYIAQSAFADDFTLTIYYGVIDSIEAAGCEAVVYNPDFDAAARINIMEDAIAKGGLAGIILHPIDSTLIVSAIEKANAAGIPVVNTVAGSVGGEVLVTVRYDTAAEGRNACELIVAGLEEKYGEVRGKVLEVHGGLQKSFGSCQQFQHNSRFKFRPEFSPLCGHCEPVSSSLPPPMESFRFLGSTTKF